MLRSNLANLQTEIETPYQARGTITRENGRQASILDHFETATFYTFTPTSGAPVDFSTDLEEAKQYFSEHPDATGTFTETLDMHEYQKQNYTYDLIVQESSQAESVITAATIENAKFNYQPGDAPQATAQVAATDQDKYEIEYECWQQFENNQPVAAWYSDNGSHGSLPAITKFESGKKYVYSLMLKPKTGYSFTAETVITMNGQKVAAPFVGGSMYIPSIKTITMPAVTVIDVVEINGVTVSFEDGGKPVFTGNVPDGANYAYRCEWWELDSTTGAMSTDFGNFYENKITALEAGKTYHYGVYVTTIYGDRYVFGPDTKLKINGEFVNYKRYEGDTSDGSDGTMWVLTDLTMTPEAASTTPAEMYTVTYTDGVDGEEIFKDQTYTVESGKATPAFDGTPTRKGYTFAGWKPAVAATVTGNATYEAAWKSNSTTTMPGDNKPDTGEMTSPKTGDTGNPVLWAVLLFVSCGALTGTIVIGKKKKTMK